MADDHEDVPASPDVHFEPIVKLPLVDTKTMEEEEEEITKLRAKLFRYDTKEQPPEWKERGTGEVKILKHKSLGTYRILMRRDKTLKICANHYIQPYMELKPNNTSDRAWLWSTPADFADEEAKPECLAIRFANAEIAMKFKVAFEESKQDLIQMMGVGEVGKHINEESTDDEKETEKGSEEIAEKLSEMSVKDTEPGGKERKDDSTTENGTAKVNENKSKAQ